MLVDLSRSRRHVSRRRILCQIRLVDRARIFCAGHVHHAVCRAMDRVRARRPQRRSDGVLAFSRSAAVCCCLSMRFIAAIPFSSSGRGLACSSICAICNSCCANAGDGARRKLAAPPHRRKSALEIGDQIVDILKPDVKAHRRSAGRPRRRGANVAADRTGSRGFRSRPTTRPCRTASAH